MSNASDARSAPAPAPAPPDVGPAAAFSADVDVVIVFCVTAEDDDAAEHAGIARDERRRETVI